MKHQSIVSIALAVIVMLSCTASATNQQNETVQSNSTVEETLV